MREEENKSAGGISLQLCLYRANWGGLNLSEQIEITELRDCFSLFLRAFGKCDTYIRKTHGMCSSGPARKNSKTVDIGKYHALVVTSFRRKFHYRVLVRL